MCTSVVMLCMNICAVFAKAPTTPKILFTSARDGNREVYIMNPDGSEQVRLTQHPENDMNAVWSPTGEQILFISDRDGKRDLYLMNPDGSNIQRIFKNQFKRNFTYRDYPTWSPDGKQFAYMHMNWDKDIYAIHIANLGEQEENFLANGLHPAWSPDGAEIACTTLEGPLTLINVRTGTQKRILPRKELGGQMSPSWSAMGDTLTSLGITIDCRQTSSGAINYQRDGLINEQSISSIAMAPVSNNLLMRRVRWHRHLSYHRMAKNSFIHKKLRGLYRFSNSI